jgi:ribonuclease HII
MGLSLRFAKTRIFDDTAAYPVMQKVAPSRNRRITRSASCQNPQAMSRLCSARFERAARTRIAGIDEAGRSALFGPVVPAAVIFNPKRRIVGLDDSKKLTAKRRAELRERLC